MPLVPELYVSDVQKSLAFYVDVLGFAIEWQRPEEGFAAIRLEDCCFMLEQHNSLEEASSEELSSGDWITAKLEYPFGRGINFEITLTDIEQIYTNLKAISYPIKLDLYQTQYQVNDQVVTVQQFLVMDPDGYLLRFAQELNWTQKDSQHTI